MEFSIAKYFSSTKLLYLIICRRDVDLLEALFSCVDQGMACCDLFFITRFISEKPWPTLLKRIIEQRLQLKGEGHSFRTKVTVLTIGIQMFV